MFSDNKDIVFNDYQYEIILTNMWYTTYLSRNVVTGWMSIKHLSYLKFMESKADLIYLMLGDEEIYLSMCYYEGNNEYMRFKASSHHFEKEFNDIENTILYCHGCKNLDNTSVTIFVDHVQRQSTINII